MRSCDLPSLPSQPLMIWMRSRLGPSGSRIAWTMKTGALPLGRTAEIAAHGHAVVVAVLREVVAINVRRREVPAREHADDRPVARGGVDFLALERVPDCLAGVLACPHAAQTRGLFVPDRYQRLAVLAHQQRGFPAVGRRQSVGKLTEEVVFPRGDHADMGIVAADQAGLVRVGSQLGVQFQSQLECRADVIVC